MGLRARLAAHLARHGPINIAQFMELCLHDAEDGYYAAHPRLGVEGDFITAPHVSQMFGELLGAWAADIWSQLGRPRSVRLAELGPGDATLMGDVLRVAGADFRAAARLTLVEKSDSLRELQAKALMGADPQWRHSVEEIPRDAPVIVLANEFLDCLPVRQAMRVGKAWRERVVGRQGEGPLAFGLGEAALPPDAPATVADGTVVEWSPHLAVMGTEVGALVGESGGAALFVDYAADGHGDTLQAIRGHVREDPLANPGSADLTARVDFTAFLAAARRAGAVTSGPVAQGEFLRRLGIEARAAVLSTANPGAAGRIARQLERLVSARQMGELFQAACVHSPGLAPAGFG